MSKIIILSDDDNFLVKIFQSLDAEFKKEINITHILALSNNSENLKNFFSNSIIIPRDEYTKGTKFQNKFAFDLKQMNGFLKIEQIFYRMLDFTDPDKNYNIYESRKIYYSLLIYMYGLLEESKPDFVFFTGMPHSPHDYILSAIAEHKKIPIIYLRETNIPKLFFFSKNISGSNNILSNYKIKDNEKIKYTKKILKEYLETIKIEKREKKLNIYSRWRDHSIIFGIISKLNFNLGYPIFKFIRFSNFIKNCFKIVLKFVLFILKGKIKSKKEFEEFYFIFDAFKSKNVSYEKSKTNLFQLNKILYDNDKKKFKLFNEYKKNSSKFQKNIKYIFFPLHYQPEATNYPHGDVFIDQILAVKMLSMHLPKNFKILVKEHPDTFNLSGEAWIRGTFNRSMDYYSELKKILNLEIIPMDCDINDVIDNSRAVASLTGSTCLEAVIRLKPSIVFGFPWYEGCNHIYPARTHEECKNAIKNIEDRVQTEDINKFFDELSQILFVTKKVDIVGEQLYQNSDEEFKIIAECFKNEIKNFSIQ